MAKLNAYKGFTLLEIMVALAVLSITLVVLLGLRNRDIALSAHARDLTEATILARLKITEITTAGSRQLGVKQGDFGEEAPKYRWQQEVTLTPFTLVKELALEVSWKNGDQEESVRFTTYLFN